MKKIIGLLKGKGINKEVKIKNDKNIQEKAFSTIFIAILFK